MTVQGTVLDIYWKNLPVSDEEFVRPYGRKIVRLQKSVLAGLEDFPLEIELQDAAVTSGTTLELDVESPEISIGEIEMAMGYWLDCFDLELSLEQAQVAYNKEIFLDLMELELSIEESDFSYGINEDLDAFRLEIDGPDTVVSISISVTPAAFDLEIDFTQPDEFEVNTAVVLSDTLFDFEINLEDADLYVGIGFTATTETLEIQLQDVSLLYGTTLNLQEESTLEAEIEDHETQWGTEVNIDPEEAEFGDIDLHYKTIITPGGAKFANTTGPNGSLVIYGSGEFTHSPFLTTFEYWDFKVRTSTVSHKRGNNVNLVHIGPVKPDMVSMHREFAFIPNPGPNMLGGDWQYRSAEGYLSIINVDPISIAVVSDGRNEYEIIVSSGNEEETIILTDIDTSEEI